MVLYGTLSVLLLFTAASVSNIESVQQTLNLTLDNAYTHVFIPAKVLIWIRSLVIVLLIVAHALRHVQVTKPVAPVEQPTPQPASGFMLTPELVETLKVSLAQTTVSEEQWETPQLTETAAGPHSDKDIQERHGSSLHTSLLAVSGEEKNKVIDAFKQGVPRRKICSFLRWGSAKYSMIVKPVLDDCEQRQQQSNR